MLDSIAEGEILVADRAYDSDALHKAMDARDPSACIKPMPNRKHTPAFSPYLYRYRNLVERFFNGLKHFRAAAARFEKHPQNYLALVKLIAVRIRLRAYESVFLGAQQSEQAACPIPLGENRLQRFRRHRAMAAAVLGVDHDRLHLSAAARRSGRSERRRCREPWRAVAPKDFRRCVWN